MKQALAIGKNGAGSQSGKTDSRVHAGGLGGTPSLRKEAFLRDKVPGQGPRNAVAVGLAICLGLVLAIPVYSDLQQVLAHVASGNRVPIAPLETLGHYGVGPLSGLMLFVFIAPLVITVATTLVLKLLGVGIAFLACAALAVVAVLADRGDPVTAGLIGVGATVILAVVLSQAGRLTRARARATRRLLREVTAVIDGATASMQRTVGAPGQPIAVDDDGPDPRALLHMAGMVQRIALQVAWEAAAPGDPQVFVREVMDGLDDLVHDFEDTQSANSRGAAANTARACRDRVRAHLARTATRPTMADFLAPERRAPRLGRVSPARGG